MNARPQMPAAVRFATALKTAMATRGTTADRLAPRLGISDTPISNWRRGSYLPTIPLAEKLADVLEWPSLLSIVVAGRTRRCAYRPCSAVFARERQAPRLFCSEKCWRHAVKNPAARRDPRQDVIDAMCRACEPDGLCRTGDCPLRPFSPFLYVPMTAA